MATVKRIAKKDFLRSHWKNGLGYTDQVAIYPSNADLRKADFLWRVSSAKIDQSSPFSIFPDHDRVLLILKGEGIRLFHRYEEGEEEDSTELGPFSPYEFPGDIQSRCELISGSIQDLSIFIRKGEAEASVDIIELNGDEPYTWVPQGRWSFILAPLSTVEIQSVSDSETTRMEAGDMLSIESDEEASRSEWMIRCRDDSTRLILINIT